MIFSKWFDRLMKRLAVCALFLISISPAVAGDRTEAGRNGFHRPTDTRMWIASASETSPAKTAPPAEDEESLKVTVTEAVLLCLENNRSLMVQRLNPPIQQTFEDQERAVFDPTTGAEIFIGREKGERLSRSGSDTEDYTSDDSEGRISLEKYFPTGTTIEIEAGTDMTDSSLYDDNFYTSRLGLTVNQALLQGFGRDVNLVQLRQARLDTRLSEYELRGFTEALVAEVERTYWDYALARRQVEIVEESLKVARQQLKETKELIEVGRLARLCRLAKSRTRQRLR